MSGYLDAVVKFFSRKSPGGACDLSLTEWEALRIAQQDLERAEENRAGLRFFLGFKTGITGIAPVQTIPTTAAQWVLWNRDNSKSIILDELGVVLVSGTAGAGIVLLATPFATPSQDAVSMNAGLAVVAANCAGGGAQAGQAENSALIVAASVTLSQPATTFWTAIAECPATNNTAILSVTAINRGLKGGLIIPPKSGLALVVTSPTGTTPLFAPYASWIEKIITHQ